MTQPDRVEIKGQEYDGWTHTLSLEVEDGRVVIETFWRKRSHDTPVALDPRGAVRAAAELVRAATRAAYGSQTDEQARDTGEAARKVGRDLAALVATLDEA